MQVSDLSGQVRPCIKCGAQERLSSGACAPCKRTRGKLRYREDPNKHREYTKRWTENNRDRKKEITRTWVKNNPDRVRAIGRKTTRHRSGWAPGEHERAEATFQLVKACACCRGTEPRHKSGWKADHNHETGLFRAFLCHPCNLMVGFVEKYGLARSADVAAYLESY